MKGWDEDDVKYLTNLIVDKLDNEERDVLDRDIVSEEIHGAIKSLKQNKSPEQDEIIQIIEK